MQRVCPQCRGSFTGHLLCPRCGVRLNEAAQQPQAARAAESDQPAFWGRVAVGLILAQGLYYGLRRLGTAYIKAVGDASQWWDSFAGLVLVQALQVFAVFLGGVIAGAGHRRAITAGALVGLANAGALLAFGFATGRHPEGLLLYGQPLLHLFAGALGGAVGAYVWRPIPALPAIGATPSGPTLPPAPKRQLPFFWGRVLAGTVLAAAGVLWAEPVRTFLIRFAGGALRMESAVQSQFVTWEIGALAILLGGGFAGAITGSGGRHGLFVGLLAGLAIVGAHVHLNNPHFAAYEFWLNQFDRGTPEGQISSTSAFFVLGSTWFLGTLGGWFGGQLLPPTVRVRSLSSVVGP